MAGRKGKAKNGKKLPKPVGALVQRILASPRARGILIQALLHASAVLAREHPKAALAVVGAGASSAVKGVAHAAADGARNTLHSAAEKLHLTGRTGQREGSAERDEVDRG